MSETEQQDTNHQEPASKPAKAATAAAKSAAEPVSEAVDAAVDTATTAADAATDGSGTEGAATDARSAINGLSQAAGEAAQRAGVAAQRAGGVLTEVAGDVASSVSAHAPAVIDASRATAGIAAREVQSASSENLVLGTVFSSGLAFGLMLGRAPRVLVLLALTPVVVFVANLVGRRTNRGPKAAAPSAASKPAARATGGAKGKTNAG